jgi:hypothetical protein
MAKKQAWISLLLDGVVLLPTLALAGYLRLANLANNPGWYPDEGTLINLAANLLQGKDLYLGLTPGLLMAGRMPLFVWILTGAFRLFGVEIGVLRALTGLLGVLCAALVYVAVRRLTRDRSLAGLAALVLAIYPMAVVYSRTGFSYNLLAVWAVVFFWAYGEYLANPRPGWLLAASLAAGLALISEMLGAVFLPTLAVIVSVRLHRQVRGKWFLLSTSALLAFLPAALVFLARWAAAPQALFFDLRFLTGRVGGIPVLAQIPLVFINLAAMFEFDTWVFFAVAGLFLAPYARLRRLLLAAWLLPLLLVARTVGLTGLGYYYAIPFIPLAAVGAASLLRCGTPVVVRLVQQDAAGLFTRWVENLPAFKTAPGPSGRPSRAQAVITRLAVWTGALLAALLIIGPLLFSAVRTAAQAAAAFQTPNDWVMIDPAGARTTAEFINGRVRPQDLVIASPGLAWLIHAHVTDFQITLAAAGQATTHFPGDFPPDRFAYDCRTTSARYVVVDRLWKNWAAPRMPGAAALLDQVSGWPSVFSTGEFTVYANPAWTDDRGQN